MLEACLLTADGHATTSAGSRNDMLWSHMEMLGWMSSREEVLDLPGGRQLRMRMFAVSALGRENIEQLLSAVAAERARS